MRKEVAKTHAETSQQVALRLKEFINHNPGALVCLAAGDTPLSAYAALIEMQKNGEVDLSSAYYAGLDEWVGLGYENKGSCRQVMEDHFYRPAGIPQAHIHVFDGKAADQQEQAREMEAFIASHGEIQLTVLGIGLNGHVGFNEPQTPQAEGCLLVELDEVTRQVSAKYFDTPIPVEKGITLSLAQLGKAREILLMATGAKKREIVHRILNAPFTPEVPASMLTYEDKTTFYLDEAALGE